MKVNNISVGSLMQNRSMVWGSAGLLCGISLGVLIGLYWSSGESRGSYTVEKDRDGDGKPEATLYYERGILVRHKADRNLDGHPDEFEWFWGDLDSRIEVDDDFDGKVDGWATYRRGNLWMSERDTDKNGVPDEFQYYEHGVIKLVVWRPNKSARPTAIHFYGMAILTKELSDTNGDGLMDTVARFDAFQNLISKEELSEPISAEDATRSVMPK